jgi:hypothetical protein
VCRAIQNQCGAQTTQQLMETTRGLTVQASFSHFFLSARTESKKEAAPSWAAYTKSMECFLPPRSLLPASAQLLGFCLFGTLEMIVGLHEEKPGTLPIANRTYLL